MILSMHRRTAFAGSQATATCGRLRHARRRQLLLELRCGSARRAPSILGCRAAHLPGGLSATPALAHPADSGARRGQDLPGAPVVPADGDRHLLPAVPADAICRCRRRRAGSPRQREHADADEGAVAGRASMSARPSRSSLPIALFRYFSASSGLHAYFKLYCLAFGLMMPIYAAYEFIVRRMLGVISMSSLNGPMTARRWRALRH